MNNSKNQVTIFKLVFTHSWEDPQCDHAALRIAKNDNVLAITSGGCNILGFLLFDPGTIHCVDINPTQSWLMELKIAAIRNLNYPEFISFFGMENRFNRQALYRKFEDQLSPEARQFWSSKDKIIRNGLYMAGKYERFIRLAAKLISSLQGSSRVKGLLGQTSPDEQAEYFDRVWNTKRFRMLFHILFNKWVLARRGLVADYFHFDDGSKSFAENFYNRSRKAFRNLPVKDNYFLSLYLTGKFRSAAEVPEYLKEENFDCIKSRVGRITITTSDAQSFLDRTPQNYFDCYALSNICELMSEGETMRLFTEVKRTASDHGRVVFRNLMIPREVPESLQNVIVKNHDLSKHIFEHDRSFVYGKVAAYDIVKASL